MAYAGVRRCIAELVVSDKAQRNDMKSPSERVTRLKSLWLIGVTQNATAWRLAGLSFRLTIECTDALWIRVMNPSNHVNATGYIGDYH
jgi:hypothetical protein